MFLLLIYIKDFISKDLIRFSFLIFMFPFFVFIKISFKERPL